MSRDNRKVAIRIGICLSSNTGPTSYSVSRSSPGRADGPTSALVDRCKDGDSCGQFCARRIRVRGGAAARHQSKPVVSMASPGHAGAGRGRGDRGVPAAGFVPVAITGCCGGPSEGQAAIEIKVGEVRIRVRGTVDRQALCDVLAAVGTVGR